MTRVRSSAFRRRGTTNLIKVSEPLLFFGKGTDFSFDILHEILVKVVFDENIWNGLAFPIAQV